MTGKKLKLSPTLTLSQIEHIYANSILKQDFYNLDYAFEWLNNSKAAIDMAAFIKKNIKPRNVVDIGCGLGQLIAELQKNEITACGCEFSDAFIQASPMKDFIKKDNILKLNQFAPDDYDLVICMEVLEHLPPTYLNQAINNLKRISSKTILITVPAFGPNNYGYSGLPLAPNETDTCWLEDAIKCIPFKNLVVDENDIPDLGHISLATYDWWTQKFLMNGLIRDIACENEGYSHYNFLSYRWNTFILHRLDENCIEISEKNFFFEGFFDVEDWGGESGKIRWTGKNFDIWLKITKPLQEIKIEFYSGPKEIAYERNLTITVRRLVETEAQQLVQEKKSKQTFTILPDTWYILNIPVSAQPSDTLKFECELDRIFIPEYLIRNRDSRLLGIALKNFGCTP